MLRLQGTLWHQGREHLCAAMFSRVPIVTHDGRLGALPGDGKRYNTEQAHGFNMQSQKYVKA